MPGLLDTADRCGGGSTGQRHSRSVERCAESDGVTWGVDPGGEPRETSECEPAPTVVGCVAHIEIERDLSSDSPVPVEGTRRGTGQQSSNRPPPRQSRHALPRGLSLRRNHGGCGLSRGQTGVRASRVTVRRPRARPAHTPEWCSDVTGVCTRVLGVSRRLARGARQQAGAVRVRDRRRGGATRHAGSRCPAKERS